MNRESLFIFMTAIALSAGIVGGLYYMAVIKPEYSSRVETRQSEPQSGSANTKRGNRTKVPASGRTNVVKKCTQADGSVFWTNAVSCDAADLNNRISRADPVQPFTGNTHLAKTSSSRSSARSGKAGKPGAAGKSGNSYSSRSQDSVVKPIPQTMPVSCKFPIGMARKIERKSLSLKSDPADSIWKKSYCRWVCDARTEGCEDIGDYLEKVNICPSHWGMDQRNCGAS